MIDDLDAIDIVGIDTAAVDESVKLHGPPGTGKTTQSAARVGRLLRDHDVDVADVAWATYRRSLADDTLERFERWDLLDPEETEEPAAGKTKWIGTFHALGNRLFDTMPDPADASDYVDFCDRRDMRYRATNPWDDGPGELLFEGFSWLRRNRLDPGDPDDVRTWPGYADLRDVWQGSVPDVWYDWVDYKAQRDLIDYFEMLERPLEEGRAPPCDVLVVDEFHDATPLMAELAQMWIDYTDTVIVAGDPHQVVNSFDGADPQFFNAVELPEVLLDTTWRVPEEHWRLACAMLRNAHSPPPVDRRCRGPISLYRSPPFDHENGRGWRTPDPGDPAGPASFVRENGGSILFLTRTKMQAAGVTRALDKAGIIYASQQTVSGGWRPDGDRLNLFNALHQLSRVGPGDISGLGGLSSYGGTGTNPANIDLTASEAATLLNYVNAEYLSGDRSDAQEAIADFLTSGADVSLADLKQHFTDEFWQTHTAGAGAVGRLNKRNLNDTDRTALKRALRRYDQPVRGDDRRVSVLTIHASKGRGARHVVLYDGTSPRAADQMRASERSRKNEYRTWYVALTRASEQLHIVRDAFDWTVPMLPENIRPIVTDATDGATDATRGGAD